MRCSHALRDQPPHTRDSGSARGFALRSRRRLGWYDPDGLRRLRRWPERRTTRKPDWRRWFRTSLDYRDTFYGHLLETVRGDHGDLLRKEAKKLKQPFGGIRQHLNQELAKQRAAQLQNHELAILLAELGFPAASRNYAARIPTTSARLLSEIAIRQTRPNLPSIVGRLADAADLLPEVEELRQSRHRLRRPGRPVEHLRLSGALPAIPISRRQYARSPRRGTDRLPDPAVRHLRTTTRRDRRVRRKPAA